MRRPLTIFLPAVLAGVATGLPPAAAEPFTGWVSTATASVRILGSDRSVYRLELTAQASADPSGAPSSSGMLLTIAKCKDATNCTSEKRYSVPVTSTAFTVDEAATTGVLSVRFAKTTLRVTWSRTSGTSVVANFPGPGQARVGQGGHADDVTFTINKTTCKVAGTLSRVFHVDAEGYAIVGGGAAPSGSFAQFAPRKKAKPTCV